MSNEEMKPTNDKRSHTIPLMPRLRFPEFRSAGAWKPVELSPFLRELSKRVPSSTKLPIYSSSRNGLQLQKEYFDDRELFNEGEYGVVPTGHFVYRHMSDDGTFKFNINRFGRSIAVSKEYPVFSVEQIDSNFLQYLLNEGGEFKEFAIAQKKGGTRTRLYLKVLRTFSPHLPLYEEQKRIADCLSSIDDVIVKETQKLDALKAHKKGLMQQFFPAEGEATPCLRFPKFRGAVGWKKQKVSEILKRISKPVKIERDRMYTQIGIRSHGKGIFHKDVVSGTDLGNKKVYYIQNDCFILNIVFAWEQAVAVTTENESGMIASHRFPMYKSLSNKADVNFIKYFFMTNKGKELLGVASPGGAGRNKTLGQKEFENLELLIPGDMKEQTKISDCLSSIADLIELQTQKLDRLKAHKKGLMQQLFPDLDEAEE
ncbi:MAG: hypothetical protein F8N37_04485 [Telmatospirillum sp.]|nr:hypothetical protein [Telmatospirillum sp.]